VAVRIPLLINNRENILNSTFSFLRRSLLSITTSIPDVSAVQFRPSQERGYWLTVLALVFLLPVPSTDAQTGRSPYVYSGDIKLDISKVPFSRFGSYISFSDMKAFQLPLRQDGVFLRDMHQGGSQSFRVEVVDGQKSIPFTVLARPTILSLISDRGKIDISFEGPDRLRLRGKGVGIKLIANDSSWAIQDGASRWEVINSATKYMLWPIKGNLLVDAPWNGTGSDRVLATFQGTERSDSFDAEIDAFTTSWASHKSDGDFAEVQAGEQRQYFEWLHKMPEIDPHFGKGAEVAAYVNWESVVRPEGNLKRPSMFMSKNWMNALWSWDHCFNAMAETLSDDQLAWDQFMLPIDMQNSNGAFPDKWDSDNAVWEYSKPPVHGWALAWMLQQYPRFGDLKHLQQVYEPMVRWTNWYFEYRDSNHNGFPEYRHGDESGWDNSTVMLSGSPVEAPDLDAYLILQMETLSKLANVLGKKTEAQEWQRRSGQLLQSTISHFWRGNKFVAYRSSDGSEIQSDSLQLSMPLILGKRLPKEIQTRMVENLRTEGRFMTGHGLATEALDSKYYTPDGYWRGPIWAPTTMILAQSLDEIGQEQFANDLREKFCEMAQEQGMAENYDATTGQALRDPAYTWASSVYLIFAHQLFSNRR
jgi:putative isomerase